MIFDGRLRCLSLLTSWYKKYYSINDVQDIVFTQKRVYLVLNFLDRLTLCGPREIVVLKIPTPSLSIILTTHSLLSYLKYLQVLDGVMAQMDVY